MDTFEKRLEEWQEKCDATEKALVIERATKEAMGPELLDDNDKVICTHKTIDGSLFIDGSLVEDDKLAQTIQKMIHYIKCLELEQEAEYYARMEQD